MLCPKCKDAVPGGGTCPRCNCAVPERETFSGQGGHYLLVLVSVSVVLSVSLFLLDRYSGSLLLSGLTKSTEWHWFGVIVTLLPIAIGIYYWSILRNEEITVTDEYIYRRSHWGNEKIIWRELDQVRELTLHPRETRVGRVSWFSRFFHGRRNTTYSIYTRYELMAISQLGRKKIMCIEPSTIDDVDWLLELISRKALENGVAIS